MAAKLVRAVSRFLPVAALAVAGFGVANGEAPVATHAGEHEGIVFERQQTMSQLKDDAELLGQILAGTAPEEKLAETTKAIATGAHEALEEFRNKTPGGRAKPEVWSQYADFMQRMDSFARNADAMAKVGATGDAAGVTALMIEAVPCKQCHDVYREPKKN